MAKKPADPSACDGDDWLVVGSDDGSHEPGAMDLQPESPRPGTPEKQRDLEASHIQNQILDSDDPQGDGDLESEKEPYEVRGEQESDSNQMPRNWGLVMKLLVWHDGLETPAELLDEDQKPLLVAADRSCSTQELLKMVQEMVLRQPQLWEVFPQVNRENVRDVVQVCERADDEMKWMPLGGYAEDNGEVEEDAKLQLTSQSELFGGNQCRHLLVESKLEVARRGDVMDWRRGRFYSDIQKNAWRFELQIGQLVDALDTDKRWYESRIVDMEAVYVKVHYRGWTSKWDEWLHRTSGRLAQLHTRVSNWRVFQVGDEILVGSEVPGKRYPEWRDARVTACDTDDGSLQIEVDVDGKKKWFDAQDELLCQKGTHKAVNAGAKVDSTAFSVPHSLLFNYFERPVEFPPSPSPEVEIVNEMESVCEAAHAIQLADSDADGDEWCVVDDGDDDHAGHVEEGAGTVTPSETHNQTDITVGESEVPTTEGHDSSSASAAVSSDGQPRRDTVTPMVDQIFSTTAEVLNGQMDMTISEEDAWRYQLQIDELIDARDTDSVWYESRVVALSSTLVKIHYRGWTSKWDEWIERTSTRIAPLHTKVRDWRAFEVGDAVMVGRHVATKRYPEWRNAVVISCEACEVDGRLRVEVDVDGCKQWMDAQDEMLCSPGTHKAVDSSMLKHMMPLF
ncbi:hypothetical protein PHYPSEUDO_012870 [Phytophthora pseudosyringae]|uniref:DUSP domain-containing protein n=1 Tax=Phytophthora pseudosyringae TaxID=221518 RepID=A0A8T1V8N4_9STRA|nr:hypothetical protein PHYPSEUDO_012870 [Phytophthora pseudosyringae]